MCTFIIVTVYVLSFFSICLFPYLLVMDFILEKKVTAINYDELPPIRKKVLEVEGKLFEQINMLEQKIKQNDALLSIHTEVFHDASSISTEPEENNVKEDEHRKHYVNIDAPYFSQNASVNIQMIDDNLRQLLSPDEYDGYTSIPTNSGTVLTNSKIGQLIDVYLVSYTLAKVKKLLNIFPNYTLTCFNLSLCYAKLDITINYLNVVVNVSFINISLLSENLSLLKGLLFALEKDNPEGSLVCKQANNHE